MVTVLLSLIWVYSNNPFRTRELIRVHNLRPPQLPYYFCQIERATYVGVCLTTQETYENDTSSFTHTFADCYGGR